MDRFVSRLPLRDQLRPLRRRQIAPDQVLVDLGVRPGVPDLTSIASIKLNA
jgi:hypothetical protein